MRWVCVPACAESEVASLRVALGQTCRCRCHVKGSGVPPCGDCEKCAWGLDEEQAHLEDLAIGFAIKAEREACARLADEWTGSYTSIEGISEQHHGAIRTADRAANARSASIAAAIRARSTEGETP